MFPGMPTCGSVQPISVCICSSCGPATQQPRGTRQRCLRSTHRVALGHMVREDVHWQTEHLHLDMKEGTQAGRHCTLAVLLSHLGAGNKLKRPASKLQ